MVGVYVRDNALAEELELAREMVAPEDQILIDRIVSDATNALRTLRVQAEEKECAKVETLLQDFLETRRGAVREGRCFPAHAKVLRR